MKKGTKMACACGSKGGSPAETYVVRLQNGSTQEFTSKVQADIAVTKNGGSIEVKRK